MKRLITWQKLFRLYEVIQPYIKYSLPLEENLPSEKILVLAPHPDDEAIGCGGTIYKHTKRGGLAKIVYITSSSDTRTKEAKKSASVLNVRDFEFWGFSQRGLREEEDELNDRLYIEISSYKPEIIFLPFLIDNHPDHHALNASFQKCCQKGCFKGMVYSYPIWLPVYPNVLIDISDVWEIKKASIESYLSEINTRDYVGMAEGIARYWAIVKGRDIKYIETFFRASIKEYCKLWKRINPAK
ncbi:MAG: PIG-L deacetylase family protein [bacterium]